MGLRASPLPQKRLAGEPGEGLPIPGPALAARCAARAQPPEERLGWRALGRFGVKGDEETLAGLG